MKSFRQLALESQDISENITKRLESAQTSINHLENVEKALESSTKKVFRKPFQVTMDGFIKKFSQIISDIFGVSSEFFIDRKSGDEQRFYQVYGQLNGQLQKLTKSNFSDYDSIDEYHFEQQARSTIKINIFNYLPLLKEFHSIAQTLANAKLRS